MMNILVTGSRSFIARNLLRFLTDHNVYATTRETLNPLFSSEVKKFFDSNPVDVVIHTANVGGRRLAVDGHEVFYQNMLMFSNLITFGSFRLFINFGSGAEFDRRDEINSRKESDVLNCIPVDFYGLSKNITTRLIYNMSVAVNLRLYNVFAADEAEKRFITTALSGGPITAVDRYMDFFYIDDLAEVVRWCIANMPIALRDINCVYRDKYKLEQIASIAQEITGGKDPISVSGRERSYTGDGTLLSTLPIELLGLAEGMKRTHAAMLQSGRLAS